MLVERPTYPSLHHSTEAFQKDLLQPLKPTRLQQLGQLFSKPRASPPSVDLDRIRRSPASLLLHQLLRERPLRPQRLHHGPQVAPQEIPPAHDNDALLPLANSAQRRPDLSLFRPQLARLLIPARDTQNLDPMLPQQRLNRLRALTISSLIFHVRICIVHQDGSLEISHVDVVHHYLLGVDVLRLLLWPEVQHNPADRAFPVEQRRMRETSREVRQRSRGREVEDVLAVGDSRRFRVDQTARQL